MPPFPPGREARSGPQAVSSSRDDVVAKLLLIEDDAATAEEILGDLRGRGHAVAWAATGPEGAERAGGRRGTRSSSTGCSRGSTA